MSRSLPKLVCKLCYSCDAWIVGGACVDDTPRDYDVVIPFSEWNNACILIPEDSSINTFGGFTAISEGYEVDIWPAELSKLMKNEMVRHLWHPQSGSRFSKTTN